MMQSIACGRAEVAEASKHRAQQQLHQQDCQCHTDRAMVLAELPRVSCFQSCRHSRGTIRDSANVRGLPHPGCPCAEQPRELQPACVATDSWYVLRGLQMRKTCILKVLTGGGYVSGSAQTPGDGLVNASNGQIMYVSIQYRLGMFGFLAGMLCHRVLTKCILTFYRLPGHG